MKSTQEGPVSEDGNLQKYQSADVVAYYAGLSGLQPVEDYLFHKWLPAGGALLDLGVGGGRTTPALAALAGRYVGADYSLAMVEACRRRWPEREFVHCDATDMACFAAQSFDAVVFPINGIDVIRSDAARASCLAEIARVLRPGGVFIFSSHNARVLGTWPLLRDARGSRIPWRILRALVISLLLAPRQLLSRVFWRGEGYLHDPVHGGMNHYVSTPQRLLPQLQRVGFELLETANGHYPDVASTSLAPWFYYACRLARQP